MSPDYFESSSVSGILSWVFAIPVAIYLIAFGLRSLLERTEGMPAMYIAWLFLCIVVLSPFRYILFQVVAGVAFPFQSFVALLDTLPLVLYVPIVLGVLYAIGLVLPVFLITAIASTRYQVKRTRLLLSSLLAPLVVYLGTLLFFLALPLGSWTVHWLKAEEIIPATNGPAFLTYQYVARWGMPIQFSTYTRTVAQNDKEMFRSHVAAMYLSEREQVRYLKHAHPDFYETLPQEE